MGVFGLEKGVRESDGQLQSWVRSRSCRFSEGGCREIVYFLLLT